MLQPFVPEKLPIVGIDWEPLISLIGGASRALAGYNGVLYRIPAPSVLLSPLTTQEAVLSSRIEGTRATLGEVLRHEAADEVIDEETRRDIHEIINYRRALRQAQDYLEQRPFCLNLVLKLHNTLLDSVRGRNKARGRFRTTQNYITGPRGSIEDVQYVPPDPALVPECLDNWEKYYHLDRPDPLVQLAVLHAQFEIIHPFLDGNGRLGRMIVPLFLYDKKLLSQPTFYLSAYLEMHRDEYLDRLKALSAPGHWSEWIAFFLQAIISQAEENGAKARSIVALYDNLKDRVLQLTNSRFAVPMLDHLFRTPIFRTSSLAGDEGMPTRQTTSSMLGKLKEEGILQVISPAAGRRPEVLALGALINICEGRQMFDL